MILAQEKKFTWPRKTKASEYVALENPKLTWLNDDAIISNGNVIVANEGQNGNNAGCCRGLSECTLCGGL